MNIDSIINSYRSKVSDEDAKPENVAQAKDGTLKKVENGKLKVTAPILICRLTSLGIMSKTQAQFRMSSGRLRSFLTNCPPQTPSR